MALIHSVVTYTNPIAALTQFSGPCAPPPSPLLAHVYGVKNVYSGLIRLYAAYHIYNRELYHLAIATYVGVFWLYSTELILWRTSRVRETASSFVISGGMIVWMLSQRDWYLNH